MYASALRATRPRAPIHLLRSAALSRQNFASVPGSTSVPAKKSHKLLWTSLFLGSSLVSATVHLSLTHKDFRDYLQSHYGIVPAIDSAYAKVRSLYTEADQSVRSSLSTASKEAKEVKEVVSTAKPTPPVPAASTSPIKITGPASPNDPTVAKVHSAIQSLIDANPSKEHSQEVEMAERALAELDRILVAHMQLEGELRAKAAALTEDEMKLMKERDNIVAEVAASLSAAHATELSKLQQEHEDALASRMTSQKASLDRAYARDVDQRVERERGRRLSQLEETRQALIFLQDRVRESTLASADALSLTRISRALHALEKVATREGVPFADELDILRRSIPSSSDGPGKADVMYAVLDTMNPLIAHTGLPTAESLTRRFVDVSKEIRRTILVPENGGFFAHLVSRVLSPLLLLTSSTGDGKGRNDPETILARAEEYMLPVNGNGVDVEMAARELNQLDGWHRQIARDWIEEVRKWAEMRQALEVLESEAFLRSLQHE